MLLKPFVIVIFKSLFLFKCVSLKTVMMKITFIRLNKAAAINGVVAVKYVETDGSDNFPPIYGPTIIPSPKVAPINPKFLALFSGFVMSAIAACATEIFPPIIPYTILDTNKRGIFLVYIAIANTMYEIKVPDIDMPSIFLRPYLSES